MRKVSGGLVKTQTYIKITALTLVATVALFCRLYAPTLAYQTDQRQETTQAQAGSVQVSVRDLGFLPGDPAREEPTGAGERLTLWGPGDINTIHWETRNLGNKSVDLRYVVSVYWDEGPGLEAGSDEPTSSALWTEAPYVYLYPATMSDAAITADLNSASPAQFIALGSSDVALVNAAGARRFGYSYTFDAGVLDGAGADAETGDATISGATSEVREFKIALAPDAPAGFMDRLLAFALRVEAKQHRNTTVSDWSLVATQTVQ